MIWKPVYYTASAIGQQWSDYYNATELFKERFTASFESSAALFSTDLHNLYWKYGSSSGTGMRDSIPNIEFFNNNEYVDGAEMLGKDTEIYAFRDQSNHYLINVYGVTENNTAFWLHSGINRNTSSPDVCMVNTSNTPTGINILSYLTANQALNSNYGTDYIIQPLYALDEKTPFYAISGNTELALFTLIQVQTRKFLVVGKGICVEVE